MVYWHKFLRGGVASARFSEPLIPPKRQGLCVALPTARQCRSGSARSRRRPGAFGDTFATHLGTDSGEAASGMVRGGSPPVRSNGGVLLPLAALAVSHGG